MKQFHIISFILCIGAAAWADPITIYNKSCRDVYVAIYYRYAQLPFGEKKPARIASEVKSVEAQSSVILERPEYQFNVDRKLVFVENKHELLQTIAPADFDRLAGVLVGNWQGSSFYIADEAGQLKGYTSLQWQLTYQVWQKAQETLLNLLPAIKNNPYKHQVARVRFANDLCTGERVCLENRLAKIKAALEKLTHATYEKKIPTISIVCSGGGYRAMLYTLGALKGLHRSGVLDASSYVVGLSGSTWAIGSWISSGQTIDAFHDWIINNIGYQLNDLDTEDFTLMGNVVLTKYFSGQPVGFVDLYGAFIANDLFDGFSNDKIMVHLSEQAKKVETGDYPFPLYTAISGQENDTEHLWYEFSPYEVGAPWLDAYVPTWAFGRKFKNGISVNNAPEQPLGTLLGTFGLAIGITIERMFSEAGINENMSSALIKTLIRKILARYGDDRPISAEYLNFVYGLKDRIFNNLNIIHLVDAGINCNLPYVPVSGQRAERKSDMVIIFDASAGAIGAELKKVETYARAHGLAFPQIDYTSIETHAVSVFKDEHNPEAPVVIYVPRVVDKQLLQLHQQDHSYLYALLYNFDIEKCITDESCNTFNFQYSSDQARRLTALGEFNALMVADEVLKNICVV